MRSLCFKRGGKLAFWKHQRIPRKRIIRFLQSLIDTPVPISLLTRLVTLNRHYHVLLRGLQESSVELDDGDLENGGRVMIGF